MEGVSEIVADTNPGEDRVFGMITARRPELAARRERLDVGDFLLRGGGLTIIVERKSTADLAASLGDRRYAEQKARQLAAVAQDEAGLTRVVWVVEGALAGWHATLPATGFPAAQLEAAVISTSVRDGIPVLRCKDAESVAETLLYLQGRAAAGELDGLAAAQKKVAAGYGALVHVKKARNVDGETVFQMMLATIPGCSMAKAAALARAYPTFAALVAAVAGRPRKEAVAAIAGVAAGTRKLGPVLAARIVEAVGGK